MREQGVSLTISHSLTTSPSDLSKTENTRYISLDTLRGFALLGILMMNAIAFAYPEIVYSNPFAMGSLSSADLWQWVLTDLFFAEKFYALFSMLFGAGIVLMANKQSDPQRAKNLHYRRMLWLLMIGLIHGYLLWWGDILVTYAIAGMLIYSCRHWRIRSLWIVAVLLQLAITCLYLLMYWGWDVMPADELAESKAVFWPSEQTLRAEINANLGSWWQQTTYRVATTIEYQTSYLIPLIVRMSGIMLIGMALYKSGVLLATRSSRFYLTHLLLFLPLGVALSACGAWAIASSEFALPSSFSTDRLWNLWGSLLTAWGYTCLFMLIVQQAKVSASGISGRISAWLAPVGQMALTNYLMQSVLCGLIFYGWGMGLYASLSRWQVSMVVVAIWLIEISWSRWWLTRFQFGPVEWIWRSATQRRRQAWRR